MKLNKKGYMLVEIIVSFVLAISIAIYLLNLVIKFKDTNEKIYYSANYLKDKNLITRTIMEDLDRGIIREIEYTPGSNEIKFLLYIDGLEEKKESRKLLIYNDNGFGIEYGKLNETGSFDKEDSSYYKKTLQKSLLINQENIKIKTDSTKNIFSITIPIDSLYTNDNYDLIIFGQSIGEVYTNSAIPSGDLSDYIKTLYNDASSINSIYIADNSLKQQVDLNSNQGLMMIDQGATYGVEFRYYGENPNNYVEFNNELWRIISVSKVFSNEDDNVGETRIRIIKDTSIGNHPWDRDEDGSGIDKKNNDWTSSTLMTTLNGIYYNRTSGTCYYNWNIQTCDYENGEVKGLSSEARSLIDNALWYLGGSSTEQDLYADDYYNMERNNSGYGSNPTRWTGKVGVMYPSDYAYAADLSKCTKTGNNYMDMENWMPDPNCAGTNWLRNNEYANDWLISPDSRDSSTAWLLYLGSHGGAISGGHIGNNYEIRPVVVLKSNVKVTNGEGTEINPYKIKLET